MMMAQRCGKILIDRSCMFCDKVIIVKVLVINVGLTVLADFDKGFNVPKVDKVADHEGFRIPEISHETFLLEAPDDSAYTVVVPGLSGI